MFGSVGAPSTSATVPAHGNYIIYKDGKAFLIVNGTAQHVASLLAGFRRTSKALFTMEDG